MGGSSEIADTLQARDKTHGPWDAQARLAYALKTLVRNDTKLSVSQAEALEMICVKISRIMTGNPNELDHWTDIAGYATLAKNEILKTLEKKETKHETYASNERTDHRYDDVNFVVNGSIFRDQP